MKKICFVTATRAEYGLLKWLMKDVEQSEDFKLQIIATGAHLMKSQGNTIERIKEDGFAIDETVNVEIDTSDTTSIAEAMGKMGEKFAAAYRRLCPDYIVVLGDRYELLPICSSAFVMNIPIIHFSGGDVTEGAIDDGIRNAVTMLASYHFPGTKDSAENIVRMRGSSKNVWTVGEPGLDSFFREKLLEREDLGTDLKIDVDKKWCLFTYHPETRNSLEHNLSVVRNCIEILAQFDIEVVATYANADYGGEKINEILEIKKRACSNLHVVPSLGNLRYLSFMKQAALVIGNSSSGIIEAPFAGVPVINIGNRQKGRHLCSNIICSDGSTDSLKEALKKIQSLEFGNDRDYWGDGHTAEKFMSILQEQR